MPPTTLIVIVVVPHEGRYLVIQERDGTWYLPAGKVEPGENLMAAAIRETLEEAGVAVGLRGIFGFDHDWSPRGCRMRFAFVGYVAIDTPPKRRPDKHSRGARWVGKAELALLPLRHPEVMTWIDRYESGASPLPCRAYEWLGPASGAAWAGRLG